MRSVASVTATALLLGVAAQAVFAQTLPLQTAHGRQSFAATSAPGDVPAVNRANAVIVEMLRSDRLERVSAKADRSVPGRLHEYFAQVHRGVPIHGAGLARQSVDGMPLSVFGITYADVDVDIVPSLDADAAAARMEALAGAERATDDPPELVILPTMLGELVLAWSATMLDLHTWFIDAHDGEPVQRLNRQFTESAVGTGLGITGALQKVSTWSTDGAYEAWDRLRPAEIVTLDASGDPELEDRLRRPNPAWLSVVASDDDNDWADPAVVDGHANLGLTYDYLFENQNWRGMDGKDGRIISLVNLEFQNAYYLPPPFGPQGTGMLAFGETFDGVSIVSLDIAAHELMHGVTESALTERTGEGLPSTLGLVLGPSMIRVGDEVIRCGDSHSPSFPVDFPDRFGPYLCFDDDLELTASRDGRLGLIVTQGGSINEAYSDMIATAVEFSAHPPGEGALRADYQIGEDAEWLIRRLDTPGALRAGGVGPYPDAWGQEIYFVWARWGDRGASPTRFGVQGNRPFERRFDTLYDGVHWNSTILSHAYYLAIEGGQHSSGQTVEGVGVANRLQVEQAFFRALVDLAPPRVNFQIMGFLIRQAALDLHGAESDAFTAIHQALTAVGL